MEFDMYAWNYQKINYAKMTMKPELHQIDRKCMLYFASSGEEDPTVSFWTRILGKKIMQK